ncbi:MAG TPA: SMP-30/gluconolactonase/LRE family protein [Burkholderiales bacterium]|nr:SMP-30/gluconolactonase/LRE family protein [Burkholderiales bacterium]
MTAGQPSANPSLKCALPGADVLGETPLWCTATQSLLWLDIDSGRLQRFRPATGRHDTFTFDGKFVGSLALMHTPSQVLLGIDLGLFVFDMASGETRLLCQVEPADHDNRLNDGRCDAQGRFWVGTMDNQLHRPNGALYCVDPDGSAQRMFDDVIVSNTIAISPAQDTLYFSDTRRFITWQFALDAPSGTLGERRVFVDHGASRSRPDGACVDSRGYVWNAIFGGARVVRFSPAGGVDRVIDLPVTNPTCVCLGGDDLKTLYITTARKFLSRTQLRNEPLAGSVLAIDVEVPGMPEKRFGHAPRLQSQ